jgi:hypothetical protein
LKAAGMRTKSVSCWDWEKKKQKYPKNHEDLVQSIDADYISNTTTTKNITLIIDFYIRNEFAETQGEIGYPIRI